MNLKKPATFLIVLGAAAGLAGCATAPAEPVAELAEAQALVQQADSAGASQFAAGSLAQAHSELAEAQTLAKSGKTDKSRQSAQRASADARLALASTERAKAEKAATDSDASLNALRAEAQRK